MRIRLPHLQRGQLVKDGGHGGVEPVELLRELIHGGLHLGLKLGRLPRGRQIEGNLQFVGKNFGVGLGERLLIPIVTTWEVEKENEDRIARFGQRRKGEEEQRQEQRMS